LSFSVINDTPAQYDALSGDLGFYGPGDRYIRVTLETVSIPYEGLSNWIKPQYSGFNRTGKIQCGNIWRYYLESGNNSYLQYNISKIEAYDTAYQLLDLAHCNGMEFPDSSIHGAWGYAKYKITILDDSTKEKFMCYLNSLDNSYGDPSHNYFSDFYFHYYPADANCGYGRVAFFRDHGGFQRIDTLYTRDTTDNGNPSKEWSVWYFEGQGNPYYPDFSACSTPFPVSPYVIDVNGLREFIVGTHLTLKRVYQNNINNYWGRLYGYNTVDTIDGISPNKYYSLPPIPNPEVNNVLDSTFVTPAARDNSMKLIFQKRNQANDLLILSPQIRLWISGRQSVTTYRGDTIIFEKGTSITFKNNSQINTCFGGAFIDSGASKTIYNNAIIRAYKFSSLNFAGEFNHIFNNNMKMTIDSLAVLRLGDSTVMTFDGPNAKLILNPTSRVYLGKDAKIIFKNGANFSATNVTFSSAIANKSWDGIEINGSCAFDSIVNCRFYNAKNAIRIIGNESAASYLKIIKNNVINVANDGINGIYLENCVVFQCIGDTINTPYKYDGMPSCGIQAKVTINAIIYPMEAPISENIYAMQIIGNMFHGGNNSLFLTGFSDIIAPFYIYKNWFYKNQTVGNNYIIGRMMTGKIKNNYFANSAVATAISLIQSTPDIFGNNINSESYVINMTSSYPNLAPQMLDNGQISWRGGKNLLNSMNYHDVYVQGGFIFTDMGENSFSRNTSSNNIKHIAGNFATYDNIYYTRNNCWNNGSIPNISLTNSNNVAMTPDYSTINFSCIPSNQYSDFVVTDMGCSIYDTTFISNDETGELPSQADIFYAQADQNKRNEYYFDAILNYKTLINNYPEFKSLNPALYDLYECYERADTSRIQSVKDILYGDLKTFLTAKIQSELYSDEFKDIAYNIVLFCEARILNYTEALEGFEFIALSHPDPAIRLMASWDYIETLDNAGGQGGGTKEIDVSKAKEVKRELNKRYKKLDRLIDKNPVMREMKNIYRNEGKKRLDDINKSLEKEGFKGHDKTNKLNTFKKDNEKIYNRASMNLLTLNKLPKEQKEKQFIEDLMVNTNPEYNKDKIVKNDLNIPSEYALYQNYPNPFNPTTTIKYSIPQNSMVKLAVYDILGREISVLVNELQKAGNYSTILNASEFNLPSGVYFYRINAGSFSQTKRLVLLK